MKFVYKVDGLIFIWTGEDTIYLYRKAPSTFNKTEIATYERKSNVHKRNIYKLKYFEIERLTHIYQILVTKKKNKLAFTKFLYRIFLGCANIAEFYDFTYIRQYTYEEQWLAFTDLEKAKEYVKTHKDTSIENPKEWADGIIVNFKEKPWECGGLNAERYYED